MKFLTISFLFFLGMHATAQNCEQEDFYFSSQDQIDSFSANFPNCTEISGSIRIIGEGITNLDGLKQVTSVGFFLWVENTSLIDLSGLDNIDRVGINFVVLNNPLLQDLKGLESLTEVQQRVYIQGNESLQSIEGIQNIELEKSTSITILDCPNLNYCQIDNLCSHFENYGPYFIYNNGESCNNRRSIVEGCNFPADNVPRVQFHYEDFEDWPDAELPLNWTGNLEYVDGLDEYNIVKAPALNAGEYALLLKSNVPFFEGNLDTRLELELAEEHDLIDVSFTFKCIGTGSCSISTRDKNNLGQVYSSNRIWNVPANDSMQYDIVLQNIPTKLGVEINSIVFEASPIWTALGSFGISEFYIDDLTISKKDNSSSVSNLNPYALEMYPNPVSSQLSIQSSADFEQVYIYNALMEKVQVLDYKSPLDLGFLSSGVYFLAFKNKQSQLIKKLIKN